MDLEILDVTDEEARRVIEGEVPLKPLRPL
jgi:hypothetical protein